MLPFPGESVGLWDAATGGGSGANLWDDLNLRTGSATLAAGDDWRTLVRSGWADYLEDDSTPVTVSWVVEVLSGSVTVTASEGLGANLTDATPTSIGTVTLSAGTNVIDSTFTVYDVLPAPDDMLLRLDATTGSAVVQQVKLRVWPTAGVAGGWSDPYPAYTIRGGADVNAASSTRSLAESAGGAPGPVLPYWETVKAAIQAQADDTFTDTLSGGGSIVAGQLNTETHAFEGEVLDSEATWTLSLPFCHARRFVDTVARVDPDLPLVDGVDYIRPPEEVFGDDAATLDALGTVGVSWDATTGHLQTINDTVGGGEIFVEVVAYTPTGFPTVSFTWPDSTASAQDGAVLTLPDSDDLIFAATHSLMRDDVPLSMGNVVDDWRFVVGNGAYTFSGDEPAFVGLSYLTAYPAYRLWNPTAVRVIPLRQYHRDDGLGVTPPRAYGGASRNRTGRAYGYA